MSQPPPIAAEVADRVAAALESADLEAFADLLAPDAQWGAPDDPVSGCHSRDEVLRWYRASRAEGMRAEVTEMVVGPGKLLVGVRVAGTPDAEDNGGSVERWQVLTMRNGQVADIRGFDDRSEAARRAGIGD